MPTPIGFEDVESWQNMSDSTFGVMKFGAAGTVTSEVVGPRKTFHLSTRERMLNMESAATPDLDPFTNGMFNPVTLIETSADAEQIQSNPNILGEAEMAELVTGPVAKLRERLEGVTNLVLLKRMKEIGEEKDARVANLKAIDLRIEDVDPMSDKNNVPRDEKE